MSKVQLQASSILNVPVKTYNDEFLFIVNGSKIKTNRLIADLLSPRLCKIHSSDPTLSTFTINTKYDGNFSNIIDLVSFNEVSIPTSELSFASEVLEILENKNILFDYDETTTTELNIATILTQIKKHEQYQQFYSEIFEKEIDFISSHFYEMSEKQEEELQILSIDTISRIINSEKLVLNSEDQLLRFVNKIYIQKNDASYLYETVKFENVDRKSIFEFVSIFDLNDLNNGMWKNITKLLCENITKKDDRKQNRYKSKKIVLPHSTDEKFNGIINYMKKQPNYTIKITASSVDRYNEQPENAIDFDNINSYYSSKNIPNSWLKIDFGEHRVIATDYTLRSCNWNEHYSHPKSWVIEGSNDNNSWEIIDEEENCQFLVGASLVHTFKMNISKEFKYIRMRCTGPDSSGDNYLPISAFEIYGTLI